MLFLCLSTIIIKKKKLKKKKKQYMQNATLKDFIDVRIY